jgi:hypothetical protein
MIVHIQPAVSTAAHGWMLCAQAAVLAQRFAEAAVVRHGAASRWTTHSRIQAATALEACGDKVCISRPTASLQLPCTSHQNPAVSWGRGRFTTARLTSGKGFNRGSVLCCHLAILGVSMLPSVW